MVKYSPIDIFNRDIRCIHKSNSYEYKVNMIKYSIKFYENEMNLSDLDQAKIFTNFEYKILIHLYKHELDKLLKYNI